MNTLASFVCVELALLLAQSPAMPIESTPDWKDFPQQIWVQEPLRDAVADMWAHSPTFRRQCLEIQSARAVHVELRVDGNLLHHPEHRAMCEMTVFDTGALIARISVAPHRLHELIAHELEHVCERLEGVRIDRKARVGLAGYYTLGRGGDERYESDRAVRIGRQVQAEITAAATATSTAAMLTKTH